MKIGDLVIIKWDWDGYKVDSNGGKPFMGVIQEFLEGRELDDDLQYKWRLRIALTDGRPCWAYEDQVEVINENR